MKGQLTYIILILIAVLLIGNWIFLSYKSGDFYQKKVLKNVYLDKLSNYLELSKTYSKISFIFSVNSALFRVASLGGTTKVHRKPSESEWIQSWVCNGKKFIPTVDDVRYFLSEEALKSLNIYMKNLSRNYDIARIDAKNYTCINFNVTNSDVLNGVYDEGNFSVGCYGSQIIVSHSNLKFRSPNNYYLPFYDVRFWKLYRGFRKFIETTNFNPCECIGETCKCHGNPCTIGCEPYKECLNKKVVMPNLNKLQEIMNDSYIKCVGNVTCTYEEDGPPCINIDTCLPWEGPPCCFYCEVRKKKKACYDKTTDIYANNKYNISFGEIKYQAPIKKSITSTSCSDRKCQYWYEKKATYVISFSCKDTKYYVSTPSETSPEPITFSITVTAAAKYPKACKISKSCQKVAGENYCNCPLSKSCIGC